MGDSAKHRRSTIMETDRSLKMYRFFPSAIESSAVWPIGLLGTCFY
jgi:hypothetical protein